MHLIGLVCSVRGGLVLIKLSRVLPVILMLLGTSLLGSACSDTCPYSRDDECDEGGFAPLCPLGTDTTDCRGAPALGPAVRPVAGCSETCDYSDDGECDDGGPGSITDLCVLGTDCLDCGAR